MMYSERHLPDIEQWSQSSGSNVISRLARPGLAGLRHHNDQDYNNLFRRQLDLKRLISRPFLVQF